VPVVFRLSLLVLGWQFKSDQVVSFCRGKSGFPYLWPFYIFCLLKKSKSLSADRPECNKKVSFFLVWCGKCSFCAYSTTTTSSPSRPDTTNEFSWEFTFQTYTDTDGCE
jgi:hypothetical protein